MIFDIDIELELLESQPEWCGIMDRVSALNKDRNYHIAKLDKDPQEWVQKKIEKIELDIKFFENILLFWASNYKKMEIIALAVDRQSKLANEGNRILDMIQDLKDAYHYDEKLDSVLCTTFINLAKEKGMNTDKMDKVLTDLRTTVRDYQKHMFGTIDKHINKIIDE